MTDKVRGIGRTVSTSVTRPANTTAYASGDVVGDGNPLTFGNAAAGAGEPGVIQQVIVTSSAYVSPAPDMELWLFDTTFTADADNAAFTPTDAELATLVGIVPLPISSWRIGDATAGVGGNQVCVVGNLGMPFNAKPGKNELYGALVIRNAYVPISGEIFNVRMQILD